MKFYLGLFLFVIPAFAYGAKLEIADIGERGMLDIIVNGEDGVHIFHNDGRGGLREADYQHEHGGDSTIQMADLNLDGIQDMLVLSPDRMTLTVWLGLPSRDRGDEVRYHAAGTISFPQKVSSYVLGDLRRNGHLDIVALYEGSTTPEIFYGNGKGEFFHH